VPLKGTCPERTCLAHHSTVNLRKNKTDDSPFKSVLECCQEYAENFLCLFALALQTYGERVTWHSGCYCIRGSKVAKRVPCCRECESTEHMRGLAYVEQS
jgi:hypothetical protein